MGRGAGGTQDGQAQMRSTVMLTWHGAGVWVVEGSDRLGSPGLHAVVGGMQTKSQTSTSGKVVDIAVMVEEQDVLGGGAKAVILEFSHERPPLRR